MKIRIDKPGGHSLSASGRTRDVQTLVNVWWGASNPPERNPVGFTPEAKEAFERIIPGLDLKDKS